MSSSREHDRALHNYPGAKSYRFASNVEQWSLNFATLRDCDPNSAIERIPHD
ncbi:hypothetical protein Q2T42_24920 [Leptolyngbya boryana CZ1]|uniref:Uncharacterized protein n=1 Tax=Leptolyngbya boryana CZ1 TaxID=3060204 RepID=A0AA96X3V1_LEPBY|nr:MULTISPECIES: hypothetical protein [Leptolyngbya]WNZ45035.1 hypothetical protein Q2T42_24920 [Leptolyngbya boryana CZ1]